MSQQEQHDTIQFQLNTPERVSLKFPTGIEHASKFAGGEPQVYYTLADGRGMRLPKHVADEISRQGIKPGQPFEIVKQAFQDRHTRKTVWLVNPSNPQGQSRSTGQSQQQANHAQRSNGAPPSGPDLGPDPPDDFVESSGARSSSPSAPHINNKHGPQSGSSFPNGNTPNGHNGGGRNGNAIATQTVKFLPAPYDEVLTHFLVISGRAHHRAEEILRKEGKSIQFDSRDICANATSFLIHAMDKGWICFPESWPAIATE